MAHARTPIALRTGLDLEALGREDPCERVYSLGSFWPYSRSSFESRVAKGFKECAPVIQFEPHISALCEFYARAVLSAALDCRPDWIVRALGSAETRPDQSRPLNLLSSTLAKLTGAREAIHLFFRSAPRPPMRVVGNLSGPEALKSRLRYAVQDLFITPAELGGTALLIDDIGNTGASLRVYAAALKAHAGVERVIAVNLAATRFKSGRDSRGILRLDTAPLDAQLALRRVLLDSQPVYHLIENCPAIQPPFTLEMKFLAERKGAACPACAREAKENRKWWNVLGVGG